MSPRTLNVYGVLLDKTGQPDTPATKAHRVALLAARRAWASTEVPVGAEPAVVTGEAPSQVHEYLVARDRDNERVLACISCNHVVSGYRAHYKSGLLSYDASMGDLPGFFDPAVMLDEPFTLRQYACPGCGMLMASEVVACSEAPLEEVRFK
ncbi:hypothetical protein [Streptomyces acidicola]|uniref:hypothetical protein n=1 Tax=Streptomyces acidicola TaxID=2596892 RepID=UPI0037FFCADF